MSGPIYVLLDKDCRQSAATSDIWPRSFSYCSIPSPLCCWLAASSTHEQGAELIFWSLFLPSLLQVVLGAAAAWVHLWRPGPGGAHGVAVLMGS